MTKVYLLHHIYLCDEITEEEEQKFIGVYSTEEKAKAAVERLKSQPGFRDHPNDFQINDHTVDEDSWTEGFISVEQATYGGREPVN